MMAEPAAVPDVLASHASVFGDANPVCFQVRKTGVRNWGEKLGSETGVANRMLPVSFWEREAGL